MLLWNAYYGKGSVIEKNELKNEYAMLLYLKNTARKRIKYIIMASDKGNVFAKARFGFNAIFKDSQFEIWITFNTLRNKIHWNDGHL